MTAGSYAIVLIIALMAVGLARNGKRGLAVAVLPLGITPIFYIISKYVANMINRWQEPDIYILCRVAFLVAGALVSCLFLGLLASRLRSKTLRSCYLLLCGGFVVALTVIMLAQLVPAF